MVGDYRICHKIVQCETPVFLPESCSHCYDQDFTALTDSLPPYREKSLPFTEGKPDILFLATQFIITALASV